MHLAGYAAAILIGLSLGIIGGGGSILTVPVIVYLFGIPPLQATSYSLFIVGVSSLAGAAAPYSRHYLDIKTALLFGTSSVVTVLITRTILLPHIPHVIGVVGHYTITRDMATMLLFALLMIAAAWPMIHPAKEIEAQGEKPVTSGLLLPGYGVLIGLVTGLLGAGGGFLLIPALVVGVGLPMKKAVATSLLIIAVNSLIGFAGDIGHYPMNWWLLGGITVMAMAGTLAGRRLGGSINGTKLRRGFGWFVLAMGGFILVKELLLSK